jgi:NAD(P)H-dependent FMN reductase
VWAQDHLRKSLGLAGARPLELELAVPKAHTQFGPNGELTDAETRERLAEVMSGLVAHFESSAKAPVETA